ncbi:MAG: prolipoprotein diacylglyceryl transferase [Kordiimonas sp.]|nr:prolipoprotein diacylglyceryl transferase [Kordiimonas sp.]
MAAALTYPQIDPILVQLGPLAIRWYSLAYIFGLLLGWGYLRYLNRPPLSPASTKQVDDFLFWAAIGTVLGGRLGYVLFYNPAYFIANPADILALWQGGMSFHGGLLGVTVAGYFFCRRHNIPILRFGDHLACVAPIGLLFGRIANFINAELYGRVTDSPFGMIFPGGGPHPRHPSQLYEAALEGILLFALLATCYYYSPLRRRPGALIGLFLIGYAAARAIVEIFREPDNHLGFLWGQITMGQLLSLPMALIGLYLLWRRTHNQRP